jgi:hypothetical protein
MVAPFRRSIHPEDSKSHLCILLSKGKTKYTTEQLITQINVTVVCHALIHRRQNHKEGKQTEVRSLTTTSNVKLSLYMPFRDMGEWRYSSTHFESQH